MFTRSAPPSRRCAVYAAVNGEGTVIYVGISCDPERRWQQHECDKPWAGEVAEWRLLEWYDTERAARDRETTLIRALRTRWNIDESPVADEVRARYLSEFGYVPDSKPCRSYVQTLAWPVRLVLVVAKVLAVVAYVLVVKVLWRVFWAVFSFVFCSLFGIRRRRRRRRR